MSPLITRWAKALPSGPSQDAEVHFGSSAEYIAAFTQGLNPEQSLRLFEGFTLESRTSARDTARILVRLDPQSRRIALARAFAPTPKEPLSFFRGAPWRVSFWSRLAIEGSFDSPEFRTKSERMPD